MSTRPYATHYYTLLRDPAPAIVSHGACASERGAIRASVVRLFEGQYEKCIVVDRSSGVPVYTIQRTPQGIRVVYGTR